MQPGRLHHDRDRGRAAVEIRISGHSAARVAVIPHPEIGRPRQIGPRAVVSLCSCLESAVFFRPRNAGKDVAVRSVGLVEDFGFAAHLPARETGPARSAGSGATDGRQGDAGRLARLEKGGRAARRQGGAAFDEVELKVASGLGRQGVVGC
jgi:hypothetical protein